MPSSAFKIWERVYKDSVASGDDKETAAKKAYGTLKNAGWAKRDGKWSKKSDALAEFSMYITKASLDKGVMRWAAVNSDTDYDSYEERMSLELYGDFIARIENEEGVPLEFRSLACSDYWCGGMPYLSVAHYSDLNGDGVPGEVLELFVDGNKLKAKGILFDSPLGHSVWRSLKEDKFKSPDERIRISIGFLDLAHRHGDGEIWVREGIQSLCPECLQGVGDKTYMKGSLVHLALTRVPVNKRTEMVLEEKAMTQKAVKKTRKEDAASIVGSELAEELEAKNRASKVERSGALVELAESETPEETAELIAEVEAGNAPEQEPIAAEVNASAAQEQSAEESVVEKNAEMGYALPFGGATSMKEANKYVEAKQEMVHLMDLWSMFSNVAWNIFDRADIENKKAAFSKAIDEFKSMLASKAMLTFGDLTLKAQVETASHPLQPAIDALLAKVDNSVGLKNDAEKAEILNPAMQELGLAITDYLSKSDAPAPDDKNLLADIREEIRKVIQPIIEAQKSLTEQVGLLEAKSSAASVQTRQRIPQSKTLTPSQIALTSPSSSQTPKLRAIIDKSVGL